MYHKILYKARLKLKSMFHVAMLISNFANNFEFVSGNLYTLQ